MQKYPAQAGQGRWVFKGYLHDQTLVGRWRDTASDIQTIGHEGAFVLCKTDET
jgi:hypothetical protein